MRTVQHYSPKVIQKALELRKEGFSYREIREKLSQFNIPKNTLSGWVKASGITLSNVQLSEMHKRYYPKLHDAQLKGGKWHSKEKEKRLEIANSQARKFVFKNSIVERKRALLFFSGFYLGEGTKYDDNVVFANSKPKIVIGMLILFRSIFHACEEKFRVSIRGRADQNIKSLEEFWSNLTKIPLSQFQKTLLDSRTINKPTYPGYMGVCAIYYHDAKIQRFLLEVQNQLLDQAGGG